MGTITHVTIALLTEIKRQDRVRGLERKEQVEVKVAE